MSTGLMGAGKRVAFFGGSFDPPHEGHLAIARAARDALKLDTVLFAPVGTQPLKPDGSAAGFDDRVAMVELAIAGEHGFALSLVDAPRSSGKPNYTLETLLQLKAELGADGRLFFLIGADSFLGLGAWHRGAEIPFAAELIVASRPGQPLDDLRSALPAGLVLEAGLDEADTASQPLRCYHLHGPAGAVARLYLLSGLDFDVSASGLRELLRTHGAAGLGESGLVPPAVMDYIRTRRLYLSG